MTVSVLTFTASETEIVSGVPVYVEIESNIPSNIYYTIDGSTPTTDSAIYVGSIYFPTGFSSITLSAFGVDADGYEGAILTQVFSADTTQITASGRLVNGEGFIVDRFDDTTNRVLGYDANGSASTFTDLDVEELDFIHSAKGRDGIDQGTQVVVNVPNPSTTAYPYDNNFSEFSSPRYAATFNPYAQVITIDNRLDNEVKITLGQFMSFSNIYLENGGSRILGSSDDACYISGGKVRTYYNAKTKTMCSYWFDRNSNRWIKNIQNLPDNAVSTIGKVSPAKNPFVFYWFPRGRQQSPNI